MARNFHVVSNDGHWDLRVEGVPRAISRHKSRDEAILVGTAAAQRLNVELTIEPEDDDGTLPPSSLVAA